MMNKKNKLGKWNIIEKIGSGGNGDVFKVSDENNNLYALKQFRGRGPKTYKDDQQRFIDEITIMKKIDGTPGVMPIIDSFISSNKKVLWYVMPLANSINSKLKKYSYTEIIQLFIGLGETLTMLHNKEIYHRDIKLPNILFLDELPVLSDFGLADFPEKDDITVINRSLGPYWTIAPEMRRSPQNADGSKADVYSFAKTLWIALTENQFSFDGRYNRNDEIHSLTSFFNINDYYMTPLELLLEKATSTSPNDRPSIEEFNNALIKYISILDDWKLTNAMQWNEVVNEVFPFDIPTQAVWKSGYVKILQKFAKYHSLNHMFFPDGGGVDLTGACISNEEGCIEIDADGLAYVMKPKVMYFENINNDSEFSYIRIELDELQQTDIYEGICEYSEELCEVEPLKYINRYYWDEHELPNGNRLPDSARVIIRLLKGSLVIFQKTGIYNQITQTYDGIHEQFDATGFRVQIEKLYQEHLKHQKKLKEDKKK